MIDPQIFEHLKTKIDEDTKARDDLNQITQKLERDVSYTQGLLSRVHSTPRSHYATLLSQVEDAIKTEIDDVTTLSETASKYPYYRYATQPPLYIKRMGPSHIGACLFLPHSVAVLTCWTGSQVQRQVDPGCTRCSPHGASRRLVGWQHCP